MCPAGEPSARVAEAVDDLTPAPAADPQIIKDLVTANRILFKRGVVDGFGHVSVRHDKDPNRFLLARNMAPALVTADDIIEFALDGTPVNAGGRRVYLERFIHGEIYRARPDVISVVHSHSPAVVPFSVVASAPLRAVCHMSGFLSTGAPIFEIRNEVQGSSLLITSQALGAALAEVLGDKSIVLMRGHGSTVVGDSIRKAVYRAVYAEVNARIQAEASRLGDVTYLDAAEADNARDTTEGQAPRAWELWELEVEGKL